MIGNRLRELRGERGLTQQEVASRIGVSRQTLNAIEGGKYSPSLEVAFLIAGVLEVALERVFWFEVG